MQSQSRSDAVSGKPRNVRRVRPIASWDRRTLDLDRRSVPFLRYEAIRRGIISDLGGQDIVTTAEAQIADRAAFISMKCEMMQIADLSGEAPLDLQRFGELVDRARRSFESIGLRRRAREISHQSLTEIAREINAERGQSQHTINGNGSAVEPAAAASSEEFTS